MLESVKIPHFTVLKHTITLFGKECKGSTVLVNEDKKFIANKIHDIKGVLLLAS